MFTLVLVAGEHSSYRIEFNAIDLKFVGPRSANPTICGIGRKTKVAFRLSSRRLASVIVKIPDIISVSHAAGLVRAWINDKRISPRFSKPRTRRFCGSAFQKTFFRNFKSSPTRTTIVRVPRTIVIVRCAERDITGRRRHCIFSGLKSGISKWWRRIRDRCSRFVLVRWIYLRFGSDPIRKKKKSSVPQPEPCETPAAGPAELEMTSAPPPPSTGPQDLCASDPDFAAIFAFCERFGDSCGVAIPTFQELQDMLETTDEVPDTLVDLHIKLLRRVKKSVHVDKWEKVILKFCHLYSIPESWELEHYGYKGISIKLKLRILKTLLEAQFDSNVKFKAEINKLESSTLRSQPLGWDKSGTAYWVQFDRAYNLRVYKENIDEHTWKIVAKDRSTLVNLINELSGSKDDSLDDIEDSNSIETGSDDEVEISSSFDQEKLSVMSSNPTSSIEDNKGELNIKDSKEISLKNPNNFKNKLNENIDRNENPLNETNSPIVGETIEEAVMVVKGEGLGQECDMGNPDEPNTQNETSKNEDIKKPKLWSIDTICSPSKEVKEDIITVPKMGFFFGDDSVTCFNNVSNRESSHSEKDKLKVESKKEDEVLKTTKKSDEVFKTTEKSDEVLKTTEKSDEVLKITEKSDEVLKTTEKSDEVLKTTKKSDEVLKTTENLDEVLKTTDKSNEIDSTTALLTTKLLNEESTTQNEEELASKKISNQSVFNIKVHEEEVQITERKANEVFTKSEFKQNKTENLNKTDNNGAILVDTHSQLQMLIDKPQIVETKKESNVTGSTDKRDIHEANINESLQVPQLISSPQMVETMVDSHITDDTDTDHNVDQNNSVDLHNINSTNKEVEFDKVGVDSPFVLQLINNTKSDGDNQTVILDTSSVKSENMIEYETEQKCTTQIDDQTIKNNEFNCENSIETPEMLSSEPNKSHKIENIENINKKIEDNVEVQCVDINKHQNVDITVQNQSKLDKTILPNEPPNSLDLITDNPVLTNVNDNIDIKETAGSLFVEMNETDRQLPEEIKKHTTDNFETNATYSNNDLNLHTENDNSTLNEINNSEMHDQTISEGVNQCANTFKQINDDQSCITPKNTLHNIRNIIETDVIRDCVKANEQSINIFCDKRRLLENCKIQNENNLVENVFQKEIESVVNVDSQIVSSSKHGLDEGLTKLDDIKEISESSNSTKKTIKQHNLLNKLESFNVDTDKVDTEKSETNIKELKTIMTDNSNNLTRVKDNEKPTKNETIDELTIPSTPSQKSSNIVDPVPKFQTSDEIVTSLNQCIEVKQENLKLSPSKFIHIENDVKLIKTKKEKCQSVSAENKTVDCLKNELENKLCDKKKVVCDIYESTSTIETEEKNSGEVLLNDENLKEKSPIDNKTAENKYHELNVNLDVTNQKLKMNEKIENIKNLEKEDEPKSSDEQTAVQIYEKTSGKNEETIITSPKEECDNSEIIDQKYGENDKKSDEVEETPKKKGRPGRKKGKRGRAKNYTTLKKENKNITEERVKRQYKPRQKKVVTIVEEVTVFPELACDDNKRRSRRIAEIKIKEQVVPNEQYDDIDMPPKASKKRDKIGKKMSTPTKKVTNIEESDYENKDEDHLVSKKFKKRKKKGRPGSLKKLNTVNPWNVDSESSASENHLELFEDFDHEEEDETPRPGIEPNISDHEFSPESDINEDEDEYFPEKRARTAHKKDPGEELEDEMACRKCNKSDQPEWILLCDTCNQGWHASCLRPALMAIPDGDWYCPPCRHKALLCALKDILKKYDGESKKRENEELRRKRLAYVGISLQNVIPSKAEDIKTEKQTVVHESSEDDEEESESESYDSEPLYQLRARRQANISYRFNDYDNMIDEAIFEETGIDESASRKLTEVKADKNDNDKNSDTDNEESRNREDSPIAPALLHLRGRKKSKKLTNLDISSDDGSDEDFKGPSEEDDDFDEDLSEYSDDSVKKRPQPTRRSVRNRKNLVDPDFINDDSSEESDNRSKKKRSRPWSDSSNSEEEDLTWGKKKRKQTSTPSSSSYKQPKRSKKKHNNKSNKSKIKYGMDSDSDGQPQRRTRGRQITYAESDDSEKEIQPKKRKVVSDEEDEYVLNDEELEVENEDQNLETDDEDEVASNEEKNEDGTDEEEEEEETVCEDEEAVGEEKKGKKDNVKPKTPTTIPFQTAVKTLTANTAVVQSVIQEPTIKSPPMITDKSRPNIICQRLSPEVTNKQPLPQLPVNSSKIVETLDKRKKQIKKCSSPNPPVDCVGDDCYPCPPDATQVVSAVPSSSIHEVSVSYNRSHVTVSTLARGLKPIGTTGPPTSGFLAGPYRTTNNIVTEAVTASVPSSSAYLPPQVSPVYQAPLPTNYSSYPIDYAVAGTPLPPPPPTIPFRNVVVTPTQLHETHPLPPTTVITQQSTVTSAGGDSEFGGLVSYFSSQQEDDFDT